MIQTETQLELLLSAPTNELVPTLASIEGDILILGVGGKMGPSLAKLAKRAIDSAGTSKRVIGVSRFSIPGTQQSLYEDGIETIVADLLLEDNLQNLPEIQNVIFMVGRKFGSTGNEELTWILNTYLPGRIAEKFRDSRIVVYSSGNVYPLTPISHGGATENSSVAPIGEYAQTCLGRERVFGYFSSQYGTHITILRLNYAIELRYGILLDIAEKVYKGEPISLEMGNVNLIWQRDANAVALRSLALCKSPPLILNVTGPETVSIRHVATRFGDIFNKPAYFEGEEKDTALLSNASLCHQLFGYPLVSLGQMVEWVAEWVRLGGRTLQKPTHFEVRDGKF